MARWQLLLTLALCGCLTSPPTPTPDVDASLGGIAPTTCDGVFFAAFPEHHHLQSWLPPGYDAADGSVLFSETGYEVPIMDRASIVSSGAICGDTNVLTFWALIEPPVMASSGGLHWYNVGAFFETAEFDVFQFDADLFPMEARFESSALTRGFYADDGRNIITYSIIGGAEAIVLNGPSTVWHDTPNGTLEFMTHIVANGRIGAGACSSEVEWISQFTENCADNRAAVFGYLDGMEFEGQFRFHEGIYQT